MGFVIFENHEKEFEVGEERESMYGWSLLEVALAFRASHIANWLLKDPKTSIMARADLSNPDLEFNQSPHIVDGVDDLLELEMRPLRIAIILKDHKMLSKLWRRNSAWESCHFYRVIEMLLQRKDHRGLRELLVPQNHFINHFYEPEVIQAILAENPEISPNMVSKIQVLLDSYESRVY